MEYEPGDLPCSWFLMGSVNGTTCQIHNSSLFSVSDPPIKVSPGWNHLLVKPFGTSGEGGPWPDGRKGRCKQHRRDNTSRRREPHSILGYAGLLREEKQGTEIWELPIMNAILTNTSSRGSKGKKKIYQYNLSLYGFTLMHPTMPSRRDPSVASVSI